MALDNKEPRKPQGKPKRKSRKWSWCLETAVKYNGAHAPGSALPYDHKNTKEISDDDVYRNYLPKHRDSRQARLNIGRAVAEGKLVALGAVSGIYTVEQVLQQWYRSIREYKKRGVSDSLNAQCDVKPSVVAYTRGSKRKTNATLKRPLNRQESSYKLW